MAGVNKACLEIIVSQDREFIIIICIYFLNFLNKIISVRPPTHKKRIFLKINVCNTQR